MKKLILIVFMVTALPSIKVFRHLSAKSEVQAQAVLYYPNRQTCIGNAKHTGKVAYLAGEPYMVFKHATQVKYFIPVPTSLGWYRHWFTPTQNTYISTHSFIDLSVIQ